MNGLLILPNCNTAKFGTKAFLYSTITSWNSFQALFSEKNFRILSPISLKKLLKNYLILLHFWEIPFLSSISPLLFTNICNIYIYIYILYIYIHVCVCVCVCFCLCIYSNFLGKRYKSCQKFTFFLLVKICFKKSTIS